MIDKLTEKIIEVKDFPKPGIGFKDITPLLEDPHTFKLAIDYLFAHSFPKKVDVVIGIESRGFIFGAPLAYNLGVGLVCIRKKGKLPRKTIGIEAPNEYGVEYFEMNEDSLKPGQRVYIVDDLIATGSSIISTIKLCQQMKTEIVGIGALVELVFLDGVKKIMNEFPEIDIHSLIKYT